MFYFKWGTFSGNNHSAARPPHPPAGGGGRVPLKPLIWFPFLRHLHLLSWPRPLRPVDPGAVCRPTRGQRCLPTLPGGMEGCRGVRGEGGTGPPALRLYQGWGGEGGLQYSPEGRQLSISNNCLERDTHTHTRVWANTPPPLSVQCVCVWLWWVGGCIA